MTSAGGKPVHWLLSWAAAHSCVTESARKGASKIAGEGILEGTPMSHGARRWPRAYSNRRPKLLRSFRYNSAALRRPIMLYPRRYVMGNIGVAVAVAAIRRKSERAEFQRQTTASDGQSGGRSGG